MHRATRLVLAFLLGTGVITVHPSVRLMASSGGSSAAAKPAAQAGLKVVSAHPAGAGSPDIPFTQFDSTVEQQMLDLANHDRSLNSLPPLAIDAGLSQAARTHAEAMFAARQLSHQFAGEPSLPQRLAATTKLQLDQEGENVALDSDAVQAELHLMHSPPHRANLLNPAYNVIGLGVVRSGDRLYIVQDFGHALPNYSVSEVKDRVAQSVARARHQARQPDLVRRDLLAADDAACSMAKADHLGTRPVHQIAQRSTVLSYTSLHPDALPPKAARTIASHNLRSFSVGACYARTDTYPTGVYWIVLSLD